MRVVYVVGEPWGDRLEARFAGWRWKVIRVPFTVIGLGAMIALLLTAAAVLGISIGEGECTEDPILDSDGDVAGYTEKCDR